METKTPRLNITRNTGNRASVLQAGYILVAFSLALVLIIGSAGLAIDIGRMYVTKSESQSYCDSAAISAALKLDGSTAGIASARAAALAVTKGWQFGTTSFDPAATVVDFATDVAGPWDPNPSPATGYSCARVTTRVTLPLYLLPVAVGSQTSTIAGRAVAKQIELAGPGAGHYAPFSPFAAPIMSPRGPTGGTEGLPEPLYPDDPFNMLGAESTTPLTHGSLYNIIWPNDSNLQNKWNDTSPGATFACDGDRYPALLSLAIKSGLLSNANRGYIYNASNIVADTIIAGVLPPGFGTIQTGMDIAPDFLAVSAGVMEHNLTSGLQDRVLTDSDSTSRWYADYKANGHGNGAREMLMPINSGFCGATVFDGKNTYYDGVNTCTFPKPDGTTTDPVPSYTVVGWGRFFLREASYYDTIHGNEGICAEYIGPGLVEGGGRPAGSSIYAVKLVQ